MPVFSGTVASVRPQRERGDAHRGDERRRHARAPAGQPELRAAERRRIVSELASGAGVSPTVVADGIDFPFHVVDDTPQRLGSRRRRSRGVCGFYATVDADGGLVFGPPPDHAG